VVHWSPGTELMSHYRAECKHGTLMGQCRCPGPKETRLVPCPPAHLNWLDPAVPAAAAAAPTDVTQSSSSESDQLPCPHGRPTWRMCPHCMGLNQSPQTTPSASVEPTLEDAGAQRERQRIVEFLEKKAKYLKPFNLESRNLALMSATLLDAADWIRRGDHHD
jgi:hypothetical protein